LRLISALLLTGALFAQPAPDGVAEGEKLFRSQCAHCHGLRGEGGRGAVLAVTAFRHAADEAALLRVIRRGIPGTEMPGTSFSDRQVQQVSAFVRSLGRVEARPVPGDAARGRAIYETKGNCAGCHTLSGRGQPVGPDLAGIGARTGAAYLRDALLDPSKDVPAGFLQMRLTTKEGRRLTAVRINEDTFSLQVRDLSGNTLSFWKTELAGIQKDFGKSPMPAYRSLLTPSEVDDLVAYMVSLR
jgi:cytochrome c oxidase cbb3-type subunit III